MCSMQSMIVKCPNQQLQFVRNSKSSYMRTAINTSAYETTTMHVWSNKEFGPEYLTNKFFCTW